MPLLLLFILSHSSFAQISLPKIFGDSMVLQRGVKIPVWGNARPGAQVLAKLGNMEAAAKADQQGKWRVRFPVFKAGGPYVLEIAELGKPDSRVQLKDILIGDVWLASGQSNMEWQVQQARDADKEIANARFEKIRFLVVEHNTKQQPQSDILAGRWKACDPANVKQFSAVAYYFARKIHQDQNIPVGIIQSTWGGTPIETWTSREMLLSSPVTRSRTLAIDTLPSDREAFVQDSLNQIRFWDIVYNPKNDADKLVSSETYNDAGWPNIDMPNLIKDFGIGYYEGMVWLRKKISLPGSFDQKEIKISLGHPEMCYSLYFNGREICKNAWYSNATHTYIIPAHLVRSGENTIALRIAALWGGGGLNPAGDLLITDGSSTIPLNGKWKFQKDLETALPKMLNYQSNPAILFNSMINPLIPYGIRGFIWYQGEANAGEAYDYRKLFPMLITDWRKRWQQGDLPFLFVQLAGYMKTTAVPAESAWAELREAQTLTLSQPNTGMACAIDIGEADDIHPKNKQEVGRRLALIADNKVYKQNIVATGPVYKGFLKDGGRIRIRFTATGKGLSASNGKEVTGFAIAGNNKIFHWANAIIQGDEVIVSSEKVPAPVAVRYAWADNPVCNLVNSAGLPAIPFRTDTWKGVTQK